MRKLFSKALVTRDKISPVPSGIKKSIPTAVYFVTLLLSVTFQVSGQGRIVLDGGIIALNQGAYLVVDNAAPEAITRNSGHIISEGENNIVKWNIGTTVGTYVVPWGLGTCDCLPLTFTKTAGIGSGYFLFSTYPTTWNNGSQLPTGVANIHGANGADNSAFASDRFWQINAQGYTTNPNLSNVVFTYRDAENDAPNTITESLLRAKRYNSTLSSWTDCLPLSTVDPTSNTLTVVSVDHTNLHPWWMLGTLNTNRYWVATTNSNANNSGNWAETAGGAPNAGVPTLGDAIIFDGASDFNCILDSDLSAASITVSPDFTGIITQGPNSITVNGNATFSGGSFVGGAADLSVNGDLIISGTAFTAPTSILELKGNLSHTNGTFAHNNGTVKFSGSAVVQTISSSSALTFNNIYAANTAGVSVQSHANLKGILTLASNVTFDADGSSNTSVFKLLSTGDSPTQDAAVAALPSGAQVSGKVTVQRFMAKEGPGNKLYRYISSPVQNATVADLQQEIPVTGTFTGRSTCSGCASSSPSLYYYNEPTLNDTDRNGVANLHDGYIEFPDAANTETFAKGRGYALFVRGNILSSTLWDLRGIINTGNITPISFPVTYTSSGISDNDGWNLVGNPYPSTIDWNAATGWTKENLETSIYITDNSNVSGVQFASWNGIVGTNGGSAYIATGQGFWVKANGNGTPVLQADENTKAAGTQTTFFRQGTPSNLLRITAWKGNFRDETVIHFREDATSGYDNHADARKLSNSIVNISSVLDDGNYVAINSMPFVNCKATITLSLDYVTAGNYKLAFTEYESLPDDLTVMLHDNFLDSAVNVRDGSYNFTVTTSPSSYGSSRFRLEFHAIRLNTEFSAKSTEVCPGKDATITIDNPQAGVIYSALLDGMEVGFESQTTFATATIPASKLTPGENFIRIKSGAAHCDAVVEKIIPVTVAALSTPAGRPAMNCGPGSLTLIAEGAPMNGGYNWYEESTSPFPIEGQHGSEFQTPLLKKSKTYYVSALNPHGCESERIPVKASIVNVEPVAIEAGTMTLTSSYDSGNQWFFEGQKIEGEAGQTIYPKQSGVYEVEVTIEGCSVSAAAAFHTATVSPDPTAIPGNSTIISDTTSIDEEEPLPVFPVETSRVSQQSFVFHPIRSGRLPCLKFPTRLDLLRRYDWSAA